MANDKIKGLKFQHIALLCKDYEKATKFYTEGLGMKLYTKWAIPEGEIALLEIGDGGMLELFSYGKQIEDYSLGYQHLALEVEDVDEAYKTALAAGAEPKREPCVVPLDSEPKKVTLRIRAGILGYLYPR